ncbi:MAG: AMP-binding protein [Planctomycetales bacterium]|nr:AMP-binding protein [Planctomycetales bacterium]
MDSPIVNVGLRLSQVAQRMPQAMAVAEPAGRKADGSRRYRTVTFEQLEQDSNSIAAGLARMGVTHGTRLVLLVRPSVDFISLVFALFKAGVVTVLIDPGMGRKNLIRCLEESEPEGFVAISPVQAIRTVLRRRFPKSRYHVTVGRRWFWGGATLAQLRRTPTGDWTAARTSAHEPAAIIFTTGSTGPPKGVLYRHGNFDQQVDEIRDRYGIQPGEIDLPGFPLFGLFNAVMGVSTVIPDMDATRPAQVNPQHIIEHVRDWNVTQSFGSPALWNTVGVHCEQHDVQLPTLRRVLSAGAPVPPHVLRRIRRLMHPDGEVHTPYGATESLPVASIESREVLEETAARSATGAGTCVGRRFSQIEWRVIRISDEPLATIDQTEELPRGEIGELIVRGPVVTSQYVTRVEANPLHKIQDGDTFWHRIGDVGYLDEQDRFWFCGRKAHRLLTADGPMYTIPCEAIFNQHNQIYRSALVGVGPAGSQRPVIVAEPWPNAAESVSDQQTLITELRELAQQYDHTRAITDFLLHPSLPVDIRHNAKIFREKLAVWAAEKLSHHVDGSA